YKNIGII
ncbi:hypothetical protein QE152_g40835, partial [Popillia japonica]